MSSPSPSSSLPFSLRLRDLSLTEIRELERYDREQRKSKVVCVQNPLPLLFYRRTREPSCFDSWEIIYISLPLWNKNNWRWSISPPGQPVAAPIWLFSELQSRRDLVFETLTLPCVKTTACFCFSSKIFLRLVHFYFLLTDWLRLTALNCTKSQTGQND